MAGESQFGVIGLEVMGRNVAQNIERNGFPVAVFNRTPEKTTDFMNGPAKGKKFQGFGGKNKEDMKPFVQALAKPRRILMLVKAGGPTDSTIENIKDYLEPNDILIDGGNALYTDTERREKELRPTGIKFFGMGVSGGEEGALWGPSLMPGGDKESYKHLEPVLTKIAAKAPSDGAPCVTYCGAGGAGHFVKMTHNGIEYGDMQLIAEAYDLLKNVAGLSNAQLQEVFTEWNNSELQSFLIEISSKVVNFPDPGGSGKPLVDLIQDKVGMKGTGTWTIKAALDLQVPVPTMAAAVDAREMSMLQKQRAEAEKVLPGPKTAKWSGDVKAFTNDVKAALYCSKICSYAQGLAMLAAANNPKPPEGGEVGGGKYGFDYGMNLGDLAQIWRAGCIIRAAFLDDITKAYRANPNLSNLLLADKFKKDLNSNADAWRRVIRTSAEYGIAAPAFSASLAYFDAFRRSRLPGNLIQGQRDFFGGHTYQRTDKDGVFHMEWKPGGTEILQVEGKSRTK
jgi:6-phosphogluconate dehydrogenase